LALGESGSNLRDCSSRFQKNKQLCKFLFRLADAEC
jgi:hypothetical protein